MNPYYAPDETRAARVRHLFDRISVRYDFVNDVQSLGLHRLWKRRVIALAAPRAGARVLDVCCGTGDLAFALARGGADVVGLDFSDGMLARARARQAVLEAAPGPRGRLLFIQGDARVIPFPAESFDAVTISYGLRNLPDWKLGLAEMWRVTKAGGRLVNLEFGKPDNRAWRLLYFVYLRWIVPLCGRVFCGDAQAYSYILESLQHYPAQRGVDAELRARGAEGVRLINYLGGTMSINFARKPGRSG